MGRDNYLFPKHLLECSHHRLVVGDATLEEDAVTYPAVRHHLLKVVIDYGISQSANQVLIPGSLLHECVQVRFHEDGAAVTKLNGTFTAEGHFPELADYLYVELLGLLFEE